MATIHKSLNSRAFNAIINGTKKIEIRANKNNSGCEGSINDVKREDYIIFSETNSKRKIKCRVIRIIIYKSIRELLEKEGVERTLSSTNNIDEGIKAIEAIQDYKELILKNGVFAIEIEYLENV